MYLETGSQGIHAPRSRAHMDPPGRSAAEHPPREREDPSHRRSFVSASIPADATGRQPPPPLPSDIAGYLRTLRAASHRSDGRPENQAKRNSIVHGVIPGARERFGGDVVGR